MTRHKQQEHILVGLSSAPSNSRIIRTAATMAAAFGGSFTALFVRTPEHDVMSETDKARLRANTLLAESLGATIETVFGDDVSLQIAEYARLSGVTKIVVGRSAVSRRRLFGKPTLTEKLTQIVPYIDIHIIPDAAADTAHRKTAIRQRPSPGEILRDWGICLGILAVTTLIGLLLFRLGFTEANILAIYLLSVLLTVTLTSTRSSYILCALSSALVFHYLFTEPRFSLRICSHGTPVNFLIMIITALLVGAMTDRLKSQTHQSTQAAYRTNLLLETNQLLQKADSDERILHVARTQVTKLLGREVSILPCTPDPPEADCLYFPIRVRSQIYGAVVLQDDQPPEAFENSVLLSILGECALALESRAHARQIAQAQLLAENEKLRANLLRAISHDLRTPLTTISGNAGILLSNSAQLDTQTREQMYADIYDDAVWLTNLVENLLAVTRIEEGRTQLRMQPHLAEEIVTEALQHTSRKRSEHTITVIHNDDLLLANCDANLIIQVLINLVDNAIKYTPTGSLIQIRTDSRDGQAIFQVSDNGPGIPDGEKASIFQMFYTGSHPIADSRRSLGLGLSLCKSIITAHGGTIQVTDNTPSGAVFTFFIPSGEVQLHE